MSKIAIGTVQFGLDYGVNNSKGQVRKAEVEKILTEALKSGVDILDTAALYGNSEEVIGSIEVSQNFKVVSKIPSEIKSNKELQVAFQSSLEKLNRKKLYGYLFHDFDSYVNNEHLFDSLEELKKRSLVDKIGFSLYYPHQLEYLLKNEVPLDMVQVPYNILDQRFAPYFGAMKDKGIEIHVRSVFLQGLFFMDNEKIFKLFGREVREINQVQALALEQNLNMNELLLSFGLSNSFIDKVVIGVLSKENMIENSRVTKPLDSVLMEKAFKLSCNDESIILPFNWKK